MILVIIVPLTELVTLYSLVLDTFIITPSKYQMIVGTGSPVAWQLNVTGFVSFSIMLVSPAMISAWTKNIKIIII